VPLDRRAPADPGAIVRRPGSRRRGSVDPTSSWAHSRWEHVGVCGPSQHWDGREDGQGGAGLRMGSRRPRPRERPDGRIGALAASTCVCAPVCCGYGYDFGSRGAREDLGRALRDAKRLDLGARPLCVVHVEGL
jgi:hypothetical protein